MKKLMLAIGGAGVLTALGFAMAGLRSEVASPPAKPADNLQYELMPASMTDVNSTQLFTNLAPQRQLAPGVAKASPKGVANISEITGEYVQTYSSLTSAYEGGCGVEVKQYKEYPDSFIIENFWTTNNPVLTVRGHIDLSTGKITIPSQYLFTSATYGEIDLAFCTTAGKPDRTKQLEGFFGDDGMIYIESWWGAFVRSGEQKDGIFAANANTVYEKSNARLECTVENIEGTDTTHINRSYAVVVNQFAANGLKIKNLLNCGYEVEVTLNRDRTAKLPSQTVRGDAENGAWNTIANLKFVDGKFNSYSKIIEMKKAAEGNNRTLEWGSWSALCSKYYYGHLITGKITTNFDISYPVLSVTDFEGEGTEANPYKIKSLDHLILLADKVNGDEAYDWTTPPVNSTYSRVYLGKHFALENDIDMAGYNFTPIGNKWKTVFAGNLDGKGHTIKNLNINTLADGYAGLFGITDTTTVLKNIVLDKPVVKTNGTYCGGLVAWSRGSIDNCTVLSPEITNTAMVAGGLAGDTYRVTNCTVRDAKIYGYNGYCGALVGEVTPCFSDKMKKGEITNCHGYDCTVMAATISNGNPAGGLFGNIVNVYVKDCSFTGTVNSNAGRTYLTIGLLSGRLVGEADNCVVAGSVIGYGAEGDQAATGGVVGSLAGSLTNCYMTGRVYGYSTRRSGGITGCITPLNSYYPGFTLQVKNCFFAGSHFAECYQYDNQNEMRETIGKILNDAQPVLENVYFDAQLTDLKSVKNRSNTAELTSTKGPKGFPGDKWTFTEGQYPRLTNMLDKQASDLASSAVVMSRHSTFKNFKDGAKLNPLGKTEYYFYKNGNIGKEGHFATIVGDSIKVSNLFGVDTLFVINGKTSTFHEIKVAPIAFEGSGTEDEPYLIKTKAELVELSNLTTKLQMYFPNTYFKMTNDIDLEYDEAFLGLCTDANVAANKFDGIFDGAGFTIHKMKSGNWSWKIRPEDSADGIGTPQGLGYTGFVGRLGEGGWVKNLNFAADCHVEGWATMAPVVGYNYGRVSNCRNYADVTAYSCWVGGIVGQGLKGSIVEDCYNEGNIVSGYNNAGGICGSTYGITRNCVNTGNVEVKYISNFQKPGADRLNFAGGIAGNSNGAYFENVINYGRVYAQDRHCGGLFSKLTSGSAYSGNNDVINALSVGQVLTASPLMNGAIAGEGGSTGKLEDIYFDCQSSLYKAAGAADHRGMYGLETKALITGSAPARPQPTAGGDGPVAMDPAIWQFDAGKYPTLKQFANEAGVMFFRAVMLDIPAGHDVNDLRVDVKLIAPEGTTWSLKDGSVFKIENGVLKSPAKVEANANDVLIATNGKFTREFPIKACIVVPLAGEGTEASPYLIKTTDDWTAICDYMVSTNSDMDGKYLKLANDLDFTGKAFKPMSYDQATNFNGTLLGDNKTMKGISYAGTRTYEACFELLGEKGLIKDLTLEGTVTSSANYLAGFVGKMWGTLENCVNNIKVSGASARSNIAGFSSYTYGTAVFKNCVNKGHINGYSGNIAGFTGYALEGVQYIKCVNEGKIENMGTSTNTGGFVAYSYPATFIECVNKGEIELHATETTGPTNIGGLVGNAYAPNVNAIDFIFTKCENHSDIVGKNNIGGLVGLVPTSIGYVRMQFTDCANYGDLTAMVTGNPVGGIVTKYSPGSTFTRCFNEGVITNVKGVYAAGIAGTYSSSATAVYPVKFTDCYNVGEIVGGGNQAAGITALAGNFTTISNCYNTANIFAPTMAGGIVSGLNSVSAVIENCWNIGNININASRAGGIAGYNNSKGAVTNCWNGGDIATKSEDQTTNLNNNGSQIGGIAGTGNSVFTNVANYGSVKGALTTAGILGATNKANTQLLGVLQTGKVTAPADSSGYVVGNAVLNNPSKWNDDNKAENVYYVTGLQTVDEKRGTIGTGLSVAELAAKDLGTDWVAGDNATYPVLKSYADNDAAKLFAATVVPGAGDSYDAITKAFRVGMPEGIVWTSSTPAIKLENGTGMFVADFEGEAYLTATLGKYARVITIKCNAKAQSGIGDITDGDKAVVEEIWFTPAGVQVAKPQAADGQVYLVKVKFADGTTAASKIVNK